MYSLSEGPKHNAFYFTTLAEITYEIELIEVDELTFPSFQYSDRFFLVDVHPLYALWENLPAEDPRIGETVCFAIQQAMLQNNIAVAYSCETSDNREKARYRKFNQWFSQYNDGTFLKYDAEIRSATNHYFVSVLVRHSSDSYQLAQEFLSLTTALQSRKPI